MAVRPLPQDHKEPTPSLLPGCPPTIPLAQRDPPSQAAQARLTGVPDNTQDRITPPAHGPRPPGAL